MRKKRLVTEILEDQRSFRWGLDNIGALGIGDVNAMVNDFYEKITTRKEVLSREDVSEIEEKIFFLKGFIKEVTSTRLGEDRLSPTTSFKLQTNDIMRMTISITVLEALLVYSYKLKKTEVR